MKADEPGASARSAPAGLQAAEPPPPPFNRIETDSSGLPSEVESDSESAAANEVRTLRRELRREKHRNAQLQAQVKRQTQLQGQLVRARLASPRPPRPQTLDRPPARACA